MKKLKGFTLLELMIVIAIIGILAAIAVPSYIPYVDRARMIEGLELATEIRQSISEYRHHHGTFPSNNAQAALLPAGAINGTHVEEIRVVDGAIQITYREKTFHDEKLTEKGRISLRPAYQAAHPTAPLLWLCGNRDSLPGLQVIGENLTNLPGRVLPSVCRGG